MHSRHVVLFLSCTLGALAWRLGGRGKNSALSGKVHLLSFRSCSQNESAPCNEKFFAQLVALSRQASEFPQISHHHLFQGLPPELMDDPKWAKHVVEGVRGRGYWFWKPALFNLMVRKGVFHDGDIVVWSDADVKKEYLLSPKQWSEALACFGDSGLDFFVKRSKYCEDRWTKGDVFQRFGTKWSDDRYGSTLQLWGQFWIALVNGYTRELMGTWEELMADFHLCSDEPSVAPNAPTFLENRHDQSIISLLVKAQAPQHSGVVCERRLNSTESWEKHPEFGIPGIVARTGGKLAELKCQASSRLSDGKVTLAEPSDPGAAYISPIQRTVCILGECHELEAVPQHVNHTAVIDLHGVTG